MGRRERTECAELLDIHFSALGRCADKIGDCSLPDKRLTPIPKFMGETLYDENAGGTNGNFHIALDSSYHDTFDGDMADKSKEDWKKLGFNDSAIHTDLVSTSPRTVTATF